MRCSATPEPAPMLDLSSDSELADGRSDAAEAKQPWWAETLAALAEKQLKPREGWLNDDVVLAVLEMLVCCAPDTLSLRGSLLQKKDTTAFKALHAVLQPNSRVLVGLNVSNNHWVLLVFDVSKRLVRLFDSISTDEHARKAKEAAALFVEAGCAGLSSANDGKEEDRGGPVNNWSTWTFEECQCKQQDNSSDCGVYVLIFAAMVVCGRPLEGISALDPRLWRSFFLALATQKSLASCLGDVNPEGVLSTAPAQFATPAPQPPAVPLQLQPATRHGAVVENLQVLISVATHARRVADAYHHRKARAETAKRGIAAVLSPLIDGLLNGGIDKTDTTGGGATGEVDRAAAIRKQIAASKESRRAILKLLNDEIRADGTTGGAAAPAWNTSDQRDRANQESMRRSAAWAHRRAARAFRHWSTRSLAATDACVRLAALDPGQAEDRLQRAAVQFGKMEEEVRRHLSSLSTG